MCFEYITIRLKDILIFFYLVRKMFGAALAIKTCIVYMLRYAVNFILLIHG
jgi:hypothetical protein